MSESIAREKCDKCHYPIINKQCACGFWYDKDSHPNIVKTFERAILAYDFMCDQSGDNAPITGDHYTGNCIALFKGTYEDCKKVKDFIMNLNKIKDE